MPSTSAPTIQAPILRYSSSTCADHGENGNYLADDGTDTIAGFENVIGTDRNEAIIGNDADNVIFGANGDDFADGAGGNDLIYASLGNKQSYGSGGDDEIWDSVGNDTLDGGDGIDTLVIGALTPLGLFTATASITVDLGTTKGQNTGAGFDFIKGFENVVCGSGDDTVLGNAAANVLSGGAGNDRYSGFGGDDYLSGDEGADVLDGGKRNDQLDGGAGDDKLTGGGGDDTFILKSGKDKITDFSSAHDTLVVEGDGEFELTPGKIKATNFQTGNKPDDKNDYFIYSQATGKLFFDADGNHSAAKTLIAVFVDHAALKFGDFLIH